MKVFKVRVSVSLLALVAVVSLPFISAEARVVTVEGMIDKVVPEKKEIYVMSEGKKHEYYFNDKTELTKGGQPVAFDTLKKSMKVKVTADKIGKREDPIKVELLE